MSKAKISVIVPCYNYGMFLEECLASIRAQTFTDFECIIIDNASTDDTKQVAEKFCKTDTRFHYLFTSDKGVSLARNLGISKSSGEYILPVDADDKIAVTYLEKAMKMMETNPALKLVYSDAELFGVSSGKWELPQFSLKELLIENSIFCSALFRRLDFEKTEGYNMLMNDGFEDWDFWISLLKNGGEVYKIPEVLFFYRTRENSRNSVLDSGKQLMLRQKIYENHKDIYDKTFNLSELIFQNHLLQKENIILNSSADLKLGKTILKPFRFLKKIFIP